MASRNVYNTYSRWQKCVVAQGDCFEVNVPEMVALFCVYQK